jgi:hypothetical protein
VVAKIRQPFAWALALSILWVGTVVPIMGFWYWLAIGRARQHRTAWMGGEALPPDPQLNGKLLAVQWKPTANGLVPLQPTEEIRTLLGRSPARADAASIGFSVWHGYRVGGFAFKALTRAVTPAGVPRVRQELRAATFYTWPTRCDLWASLWEPSPKHPGANKGNTRYQL